MHWTRSDDEAACSFGVVQVAAARVGSRESNVTTGERGASTSAAGNAVESAAAAVVAVRGFSVNGVAAKGIAVVKMNASEPRVQTEVHDAETGTGADIGLRTTSAIGSGAGSSCAGCHNTHPAAAADEGVEVEVVLLLLMMMMIEAVLCDSVVNHHRFRPDRKQPWPSETSPPSPVTCGTMVPTAAPVPVAAFRDAAPHVPTAPMRTVQCHCRAEFAASLLVPTHTRCLGRCYCHYRRRQDGCHPHVRRDDGASLVRTNPPRSHIRVRQARS